MHLKGFFDDEQDTNTLYKEELHNKEKIFKYSINPPILHMVSIDYETVLDLELYKESDANIYFVVITPYDSGNNNLILERKGYSGNVFPELSNKLLYLSNKIDNISLRFYYNLIIYSRICEAICNAGISLESVEIDRDMLNTFVNKSLEFYGYNNYYFDCNIIFNIMHIYHEFYNDFIYGHNNEFNIGDMKGILVYNDKCVYLRMDENNIVGLTVALAFDIINSVRDEKSSIIEALSWILLTYKGYYVYEQDFTNDKRFLSEDLNNIWSNDKIKITPYNISQCFK